MEWYPKATESIAFLITPKKNEKVKQTLLVALEELSQLEGR